MAHFSRYRPVGRSHRRLRRDRRDRRDRRPLVRSQSPAVALPASIPAMTMTLDAAPSAPSHMTSPGHAAVTM
jgi:hypothetical protein